MKKLISSIFFGVLISTCVFAQFQTKQFYTGDWDLETSWTGSPDPNTPAGYDLEPISANKGSDFEVFGYITRNRNFTLAGSGTNSDTLFIRDTLVVIGNMTLENNSKILRVPAGGLLVVLGNLEMGNKASVANGGTVAVTGNVTFSNGTNTEYISDEGSFYVSDTSTISGNSGATANIEGDTANIDVLNGSGDPDLQALWDFIQSGGIIPLPVELLGFSTVNKPYSVDLVWSTASESNTSHFEIYKSSNGEEFFLVGKVNAVGNSSTTQHYSYNDKAPFSGYNFYKLKSVDFDGYTEVFDVILNEFQFEGLQPYPNPFDGTQLNLSSFKEIGVLDIMITDIGGRVVYQGRLEDENQVIKMDPVLEKGMYFIKIRNEQRNYNYSTRLIVR